MAWSASWPTARTVAPRSICSTFRTIPRCTKPPIDFQKKKRRKPDPGSDDCRGRRREDPQEAFDADGLDGSGFEAHHTSRYFVRRRGKRRENKQSMTYRRFPKVGLVCDCSSHMIRAAVPGRGPTPDHPHVVDVMRAATARRPIDTLLADAG